MSEDEPIPIPITDIFDLHSIPPRDAKAAVIEYLTLAHQMGFSAVRIVHGRGIGVQREMARAVLARTAFVADFRDAPLEAGGWGATIVTFGTRREKEAAVHRAEELLRQFEAVGREAELLVGPLTREQFNWRPEPGSWSAGECLDHLVRVDRMYGKQTAAAIEEGRLKQRFEEKPFRPGWLEAFILRSTEPPVKRRFRAPKAFVPATSLDPQQTLESFRKANREMIRLTVAARGLDLRRIRVPSPVLKLWSWPLGTVLAVCAAHDRRHLHQARQAIEKKPGGGGTHTR